MGASEQKGRLYEYLDRRTRLSLLLATIDARGEAVFYQKYSCSICAWASRRGSYTFMWYRSSGKSLHFT